MLWKDHRVRSAMPQKEEFNNSSARPIKKALRRACEATLVLIALFAAACSEVHPWEKEAFTKPHMAFVPDKLEARTVQHVYNSKEGTSGGYGIGGAGCGCE